MHQIHNTSEKNTDTSLPRSADGPARHAASRPRPRRDPIPKVLLQEREMVTIPQDFWVTIQLYAAMSGYSVGALYQKIRRSQLVEGRHYRHARDGRVQMHVQSMQEWGAGK